MTAFACLLDETGIQAAQLGGIANLIAPAVGGIEHVLLELCLQLGQLEHHRLEALLAYGIQPDTAQAKIPQRVLDHLALHRFE